MAVAGVRADTLGGVARRIYQQEADGAVGHAAVRRIARDPALIAAVRSGNAAALRTAALRQLFNPGKHVVRLSGPPRRAPLTDVGGAFVVAPARLELRGGDTLEASMQDVVGYVKLVHRLTGAQVVVRGAPRPRRELAPGRSGNSSARGGRHHDRRPHVRRALLPRARLRGRAARRVDPQRLIDPPTRKCRSTAPAARDIPRSNCGIRRHVGRRTPPSLTGRSLMRRRALQLGLCHAREHGRRRRRPDRLGDTPAAGRGSPARDLQVRSRPQQARRRPGGQGQGRGDRPGAGARGHVGRHGAREGAPRRRRGRHAQGPLARGRAHRRSRP